MVKHQVLKRLKKLGSYSGTMSSTTVSVTDPDVLVGDVIFAQLSASTTAAAVYKAICSTDGTITFLMSAAPGASSVLNYMIFTGGN